MKICAFLVYTAREWLHHIDTEKIFKGRRIMVAMTNYILPTRRLTEYL